MIFNNEDGNFTIMPEEVGFINFIITVTSSSGYGYNIPINIEIVDNQEEILQYSYNTSYQYLNTITIEKSGYNLSNAVYSVIGAPNGIVIDSSTGVFSGFSTSYGRFGITVVALDSNTGNFLSMSKLEFVIYSYNELTCIDFSPNNSFMNTDKISINLKCSYSGESPAEGQILNYNISSNAFSNHFLAKYSLEEDILLLTYIVKISNSPSSYPIIIENKLTGFFISSSNKFIVTAACFNEDTTILVVEKEEKIYKAIKDLNIGDEVVTYKHGIKKITHIGCNTMRNNPESITDCMYKLSVSNKYPELSHDLILLGRHNILVDELTKKHKKKITEIHPVDRIDDKCLLNTMFNDDFEIIDDTKEFNYYHLVLSKEKDNIDRRYGVYVNGGAIIAATTYKRDFIKQFINN